VERFGDTTSATTKAATLTEVLSSVEGGAQNWYQNQNQYQETRRYTTNDLIKDLEKCGSEYRKAHKDAMSTGWLYAALLALLPIPLGWLAVYKSIALLNWIREGFRT
jgi:hypothetical protein